MNEPTRDGAIVACEDGTRRLRVVDQETKEPGWVDPDAGLDAHPEPWGALPHPVALIHPGYPR